jgi:hypothetical protein
LAVDGTGHPVTTDTTKWHLPTFDPQNDKKYHYRLHTLDIYFWTTDDAHRFIDAVRRVMPRNQVEIFDEPEPPVAHSAEMSPVVQKLENVVISDSSYHDGQTRDSRPTQTFAGPPTSAPPVVAQVPEAPVNFAPMAYNPAAPAAPETIQHREKTPPPEDGAPNPLAMAAAVDQGQQFTHGQHHQFVGPPSALSQPSALSPVPSAIGSYFPGPPQGGGKSPYGPGSIPPPQHTATPPINPNPYGQQPGFMPQQIQQPAQTATYPGSPGFQPAVQSPGMQTATHYNPGSMAPPPLSGPTAPVGGYSSYSYNQTQNLPAANDYHIHQQVYKPTEGEANYKFKPAKESKGKLEENAAKLEKGVSSFLKKLEKKYG